MSYGSTACSSWPTVPPTAELRIDRDWAIVVRGEAELDPAGFDVAAWYSDRGRTLLGDRARSERRFRRNLTPNAMARGSRGHLSVPSCPPAPAPRDGSAAV
jgi:hypothetical protein